MSPRIYLPASVRAQFQAAGARGGKTGTGAKKRRTKRQYKRMGKASNKNKGFASLTPERRREIAMQGVKKRAEKLAQKPATG